MYMYLYSSPFSRAQWALYNVVLLFHFPGIGPGSDPGGGGGYSLIWAI